MLLWIRMNFETVVRALCDPAADSTRPTVAREPLTAMILPSKPFSCRGVAFSCTSPPVVSGPSRNIEKIAMAQMKVALTAGRLLRRVSRLRLAAAVISPCAAVFRACKFPGLRRKSERLTPH